MSASSRKNNTILMGRTARYNVYPALTGDGTNGVAVTAGAGAWGAYADIIAVGGLTQDYWYCGAMVNTGGAAQVFEIQVANATPTVLHSFTFDDTAVTLNLSPFTVPFPIYLASGSQLQARAGGPAAKSVQLSALIATAL